MLRFTLVLLISFAAQSAILLDRLAQQAMRIEAETGTQLAGQLADAAAPLLISNDLITLGTLTQHLIGHSDIEAVLIFNNQQQLIAQTGSVLLRGAHRISIPIALQNQTLGHVELLQHGYTLPEIASGQALPVALMGGVHLLLLAAFMVLRPRRASPSSMENKQDSPLSSAVSRLHVIIDDPNQLLERVGIDDAAEVYDWYETLARNAAHLHGGKVQGAFAEGGLIIDCLHSDPVQRQFNSLLIAQLIFFMADASASARHRDNLLTFKLKAGLCHGDMKQLEVLLAIAETLSHTAPPSCLLLDTENMLPLLRLRSETQQEVRLAIPELGLERQVLKISRLKPEFQALVQRQAQQLNGTAALRT